MTDDLDDLMCPHSAAGRPERFPAKACILAGECGCVYGAEWSRALRLADECEESARAWANEIDTRERAAAELRRLHAEVERLRTDGASAVRWAPGSAYWSDVLRDLFGPNARDGINVVEARWRAELERADTAEALLRQALEALESCDGYIGQLELIVYSHDDTGPHDARAKVQSTIAALRERLGEKA